MPPAISISSLGKRYRYGGATPLSANLRADITDWVKGVFQRKGGAHPTLQEVHEQHVAGSPDYFWALKDINLDIKQGEVVGIIGRNGAGKSTLLKILSRITPPTAGKIEYHGRIASLLEVGTGFHRELTGRENIYLNGSILGMKRAEIARKLDEIVAFAEIEKFLDTPVKFYSSGMYVRLAFAVAAHLEPEILVVDEVLAVGDAAFQKKCLGKMGDVARQGRTVLFVSHNMAAIENLCSRGVLLHEGTVHYAGEVREVINAYLKDVLRKTIARSLRNRVDRKGSGQLKVIDFWLEDDTGNRLVGIRSGQDCVFAFEYSCPENHSQRNVTFSFAILNNQAFSLILHRTNFKNQDFSTVPASGIIYCRVPNFPLVAGTYLIGTFAEVNSIVADDPGVIAEFQVEQGDFFSTGHPGLSSHSPFLIDGEWSVQQKQHADVL